MPDSFARVVIHTTFSTKYRTPSIVPKLEAPVKKLLTYHLRRMGAAVLEINCVPDHVHIIHTLPRTVTLSKLIQEGKKWSSATINDSFLLDEPFRWQRGFAAFSVDYKHLDGVLFYVRNQKKHHGYADSTEGAESFIDEYTRQLTQHGFEIHPKHTFPVAPKDKVA